MKLTVEGFARYVLESIQVEYKKLPKNSAARPAMRVVARNVLDALGTPHPRWALKYANYFKDPELTKDQELEEKVYNAARAARQSGAPRTNAQTISLKLGLTASYIRTRPNLMHAYNAGKDLKDFPIELIKAREKK